MPKVRIPLKNEEAEAIARLSALENMRELARQRQRTAMLGNIEKLIESELRGLRRLRADNPDKDSHPEA